MLVPLGNGAVDKRPYQLIRQWRQGCTQLLCNAKSLANYPQQLCIDGAIRVGLVVRLITPPTHGENACAMHALQLTHQAALADLRPAGYFIGIEALIRFAIKHAQHFLLGGGKQSIAERDGRHGRLYKSQKGNCRSLFGNFQLCRDHVFFDGAASFLV
ncbi:hypothetical protein D9M72_594890 [compost metagenome]